MSDDVGKLRQLSKIRQMTRDELDIAVDWARQEGWNPGLYDADIFWQTDPNGFLALERDGEMIGSGSTVSYDGEFGFMGFFIVRSDMRNEGLGRDLWLARRDKLLSRLKPQAAIGMDGVFSMQPFYAKGGFKFSHRNLRMQTTGQNSDYDNLCVLPSSEKDFPDIEQMDRRCFGYARDRFLRNWLLMPESTTFIYRRRTEFLGFGTIRRCHLGWKIGPLFAKSPEVANQLFRALNTVAVGEPVFLDTPEVNENALELASRYKMTECFGCARMYYGSPPNLAYNEIYGVTTFELG